MKREELQRFVRLHRGQVSPVAARLLSAGEPLEPHEEELLLEHTDQLGFLELAAFLAHGPRHGVARAVAALVARVPRSGSAEAAWHLGRYAGRIDPDAWVDLLERLRPRLAPQDWRALLRRARGCPLFEALAKVPDAADRIEDPLAAHLLEVRYDPAGCSRAVLALAAQDAPRVVRALAAAAAGCPPSTWAPELRELLEGGLGELSVRELVALAASDPALVSRERLTELALARARARDEPWLDAAADEAFWERHLDETLREAARERLPRSQHGPEVSFLLRWLARSGVPRRELVEAALERVTAGRTSEGVLEAVMQWLGESLTTRSAWEEHGARVLLCLYERWSWDALGRVAQLIDHATRPPGEDAPPLLRRTPPFVGTMHEVLARVFVELAGQTIARGDLATAANVVGALVHLSPPARTARAVWALRDLPGTREPVRELVELTARFYRRGGDGAASLEGIVNALQAMHRGWSPPERDDRPATQSPIDEPFEL